MKGIIHFKEQCHPHLTTENSFFFRWILYFQTISQIFLFCLIAFFFFLIFAVFCFVLVMQDRENGQKRMENSNAHPCSLTGLNLKPCLPLSLFFIPVGPDWH